MKRAAILVFAVTCAAATAVSADPREVLAGDWWGTMAERRLSLRADGSLSEFRPTDTTDRAGKWEIDGSTVTFHFDDRKVAESFTFTVEKDELTLTGADGRATRLKKEARADREKRLGEVLVGEMRKQYESEEEPDQFKREQLIKDSHEMGEKAESLLRSLVGANREKQNETRDSMVKAIAPELLAGSDDAGGEPGKPFESKPRKAEPAGSKRNCVNHLKQLGIYMSLYEAKTKKYPKSLNDVKRPDMCSDLSLLSCPSDDEAERKEYGYCEPKDGDATSPDAICAWDPVPHADGTRNVLLFQGRVTSMNEDDFRTALAAAGGKLIEVAPKARSVKARAQVKDGKVVVTVRAKVIDLRSKSVDGKELVKARVTVSAFVEGDTRPIESGVHVVQGEVVADGYEVELTVTLPISDVEKVECVTLNVEDRRANETGQTRLSAKKIEHPK